MGWLYSGVVGCAWLAWPIHAGIHIGFVMTGFEGGVEHVVAELQLKHVTKLRARKLP